MSTHTNNNILTPIIASRQNGRRPTIGITSGAETASYAAWTKRVALLPFRYVAAVQQAGGRAIILTPDEDGVANPEHVLSLLDGLILSGGVGDIDPVHYGEDQHPATKPVESLRDRFELSLTEAAIAMDLPLLGVCRGMQVINVAYGGTLEQHLPEALGHNEHRPKPGSYTEHGVTLDPDSLAEKVVGGMQHATVMSSHHQGVREIGAGLKATGWSTLDQTVEAIEDPRLSCLIGVQWHPEEDENSQVINSLVKAARSRAASVVRD